MEGLGALVIIFWRGYGGFLPILIAVPTLIGGLFAGKFGAGIALLLITPAIAIWGWRINVAPRAVLKVDSIDELDDGELIDAIINDKHIGYEILSDNRLKWAVFENGKVGGSIDRDELKDIVGHWRAVGDNELSAIPVQYWSILTILVGVVVLAV